MRWARFRRYKRRDPADNRVMEPHYHVWTRSGTVFVLKPKPYKSRAHANKVAAALRASPDDRMVRACTECPVTKPSKRRPPRWATVARAVAAELGAEPAAVRRALTTALAAERQR